MGNVLIVEELEDGGVANKDGRINVFLPLLKQIANTASKDRYISAIFLSVGYIISFRTTRIHS